MAFNNEALNAAREAARIESDKVKARNLVATLAKDDAEFTAAKKPRAKKTAPKPTPVSANTQHFPHASPKDIKPPCSADPKRPAWMNDHVVAPHFKFTSDSTKPEVEPGDLIAEVINRRLRAFVPDALLTHTPDKKGDLPASGDQELQAHLEHTPSARDLKRRPPGVVAVYALRAIVPNRAKRKLITDYISTLLKQTRDACLNVDRLVEEINEDMPWPELLFSIETYHVDSTESPDRVDVATLLRQFESLCHDERCEFLTKAEKVRPLHPMFF